MQRNRLWCSVLLFERATDSVNLVEVLPRGVSVDDLDTIGCLAIPHDVKVGKNMFFAFNVENTYCSAWAFCNREAAYSIVVTSSMFRPFLLEDILRHAEMACRKSNLVDARNRAVLLYSALNTIEYVSRTEFIVRFPAQNIRFSGGNQPIYWLRCPNCSLLGPHIQEVWETIMTNGKVLIIGNDTEVVSHAGVEALCLFSGIEFVERYAVFSQEGDPRTDISEFHILATTDTSVDISNFDSVIRVNARNRRNVRRQTQDLWERTRTTYRLLAHLWQDNILADPYLDICKKQLRPDRSLPHFETLADQEPPRPGFLEKAQSTESFSKFRNGFIDPDMLRNSFLSVSPQEAVEALSDDELDRALTHVESLVGSDNVRNDVHLVSVLKQHRSLIRNRMAQRNA